MVKKYIDLPTNQLIATLNTKSNKSAAEKRNYKDPKLLTFLKNRKAKKISIIN